MGRKAKPADNLPESTRRLLEVVELSGVTRIEFAKKVGMSTSGFNSLFLRGIEVNHTLAKAVELEFGISQQWLLEGIGSQQAERSYRLSEYQKLCMRLIPRHDPVLTWECFESLQSFPSTSINTVNVESAETFEKAALLIWEVLGDDQWWEKYQNQHLRYEQLRQAVKKTYVDLANETVIGRYDQTLLFKILLDGVIPTDEMLEPQKFVCATELVSDEYIAQYLDRIRRFAQLRQEFGGFWKLPFELKKLYVRCHNDKKDFEETTALNDCRRGRLLVSVEGWLRTDNAGQILEDRKRKDIFQQRLKMARLEGRKDNQQLLEKINEKLAQLQYQLDTLLEEWGGDGTAQ
jgi:hypothetical protein